MKAEIRPAGVIERLQRLQASASLSAQAGKTAETLVKRLSSPVRVTLLGPPGVGKSRLRDILAGEAVVPPDMKLPTTELRSAERRQMEYRCVAHSETISREKSGDWQLEPLGVNPAASSIV